MEMKSLNRINLENLMKTVEYIKENPEAAIKTTRVEGEWILDEEEGPQFKATISTSEGEFQLEADQPIQLGGSGVRPSPIHYCLYGVASCTAATLATIAATQGIKLNKMKVSITNKINFSRPLGLSDAPTVQEIQLEIQIETDANEDKIKNLEQLTKNRCPAIYCLTNPIKTTLKINKTK